MIKNYTLEDPKPVFKNNDRVFVDMGHLGGKGLLQGKIVGRGMVHVIDFWMVQFEKEFGPTYPYQVVLVPHTAFVKSMPIDTLIESLKQ